MKKLLLALAFLVGLSVTAKAETGYIEMASVFKATATGSAFSVTIASDSNKRNCLTSISAQSDAAYTFSMTFAGTQEYSIDLAADDILFLGWLIEEQYCTSAKNQEIVMSISAGTGKINYNGYTH